MTLDKLKLGETALIKRIDGAGALRKRLLEMGLTPRTKIMARKTAPLGDPLEICIRGYELAIRLEDAKKIVLEEGNK